MSSTEVITVEPEGEEIIPFLSFTSFRDTHHELLKRRRLEQKNGESEEFWAAVHELLLRGEAAGAFLDADADRAAAQNLLDYWSNQLFHAGRDGPAAILAEFNPMLQPEIPDHLCPYVGLGAFDENNQHLFFGRSQVVEELLGNVIMNRLVAVVGPSDSGKSSVVLAGLLPKLREGAVNDSQRWRYYPPIVPGSTPLARLARLLEPPGVNSVEWLARNVEAFRRDPDHLTNVIDQAGEGPAVLVIDQFEEVFTLCHDEEERQAFMDNLLRLVRASQRTRRYSDHAH